MFWLRNKKMIFSNIHSYLEAGVVFPLNRVGLIVIQFNIHLN